MIDTFKKTIQWEGFGGLYKGVSSPLAGQFFFYFCLCFYHIFYLEKTGQMVFRMLLFSSHGQAKRILSDDGKKPLTDFDLFIAGSIAWQFGFLAECPVCLLFVVCDCN